MTHPSIPESRRYVRVHRYFSEMVIKPHTFIDEVRMRCGMCVRVMSVCDTLYVCACVSVIYGCMCVMMWVCVYCVHVVFFCTYDALPVPPPKLGFSFELTYFDDPQSYLPSSCVNWVTTTGKCRGVHMLTQMLSMD